MPWRRQSRERGNDWLHSNHLCPSIIRALDEQHQCYGVDYDPFLDRLVWGNVDPNFSQIFVAKTDGTQFQQVTTFAGQFVDVALAPFIPPISEPASRALALAAIPCGSARRRRGA